MNGVWPSGKAAAFDAAMRSSNQPPQPSIGETNGEKTSKNSCL